jgi:hypothetical protein
MKHSSPVLNEGINREILAVLDQYVRFYNEKNEEKLFSLFSKNVSGFGTEKDETVLNLAQFKDRIRGDFNPVNAIHLNVKILATGGQMPVAWITGLCTYTGRISGKSIQMDCRMTVVLANRGGRWLFEQVHFSMPGV